MQHPAKRNCYIYVGYFFDLACCKVILGHSVHKRFSGEIHFKKILPLLQSCCFSANIYKEVIFVRHATQDNYSTRTFKFKFKYIIIHKYTNPSKQINHAQMHWNCDWILCQMWKSKFAFQSNLTLAVNRGRIYTICTPARCFLWYVLFCLGCFNVICGITLCT